MAHQRMSDDFKDHVYETDLVQAQEPLKSSIRPPVDEDWELMRK